VSIVNPFIIRAFQMALPIVRIMVFALLTMHITHTTSVHGKFFVSYFQKKLLNIYINPCKFQAKTAIQEQTVRLRLLYLTTVLILIQ